MDRSQMTTRKRALAGASIVLIIICFATLSPIEYRPETGAVGPERFAAFAMLGILLAVAFPRHLGRILLATAAIAIGLELLQLAVPGRHGNYPDAIEKSCGAIAGVGIVALMRWRTVSR